jgi:hypothetical protein
MNQVKVASLRENRFFETFEIRLYFASSMENLLITKYRINRRYHKKNEQ